MANEIYLTPEELRAKARQIRILKENDKDTINRISNIVHTLSGTWRGSAEEAFVLRYMGMRSRIQDFHQMIESFAALMEAHADRMENVDRKMADRIGKA